MNKLKALVIGAGQIGSKFDNVTDQRIRTHAKAYMTHNATQLIGIVDTNYEMGQKEADKWQVPFYRSCDDAFLHNQIDIASVCVPDAYHFSVLKELIKYPLQGIIAEKPLTNSVKESQYICEIAKEIPIQVNFLRRFVPQIIELKEKIANRSMGRLLTGTGYYGKGIHHNGSHMIDLIQFLLGPITKWQGFQAIYDFYEDDPSVSAMIQCGNNQIMLNAVDCSKVTIFELDLLFVNERVCIHDLGYQITYYKNSESNHFQGYSNYQKCETVQTDLDQSMYLCLDNLCQNIISQVELLSPASESLNIGVITNELRGKQYE